MLKFPSYSILCIHRVSHLFETLHTFPILETSQILIFEAHVVLDIHMLIIDVPIPKMPFSHFKIMFYNLGDKKLKALINLFRSSYILVES